MPMSTEADVKAQVREKASELSGNVRDRAAELAQTVRTAAAPKATEVRDRALAAGSDLQQVMPARVQRLISRAAGTAERKRGPLVAAAAVVLLACWLVMRRRGR